MPIVPLTALTVIPRFGAVSVLPPAGVIDNPTPPAAAPAFESLPRVGPPEQPAAGKPSAAQIATVATARPRSRSDGREFAFGIAAGSKVGPPDFSPKAYARLSVVQIGELASLNDWPHGITTRSPTSDQSPGGRAEAGRSTGWWVVIAYASVCASTQVLWLTYAAITTETAKHYGVSVSAVGWLAQIFPLMYVVLALPAGVLLDRWFRPALAASGGLVAVGGLVRLGGDTFGWALAGQTLVAVAQPVTLSAVSKLAGQYLLVEQRAAGIAVGAGAGFVGMLLALLLGPTVGAHGHLERLLALEAGIGVCTGLALALAMLRPGHAGDEHVAIEGSAARALWALPIMRVLCGLVFVGFGIFVALATWLQTLLHPSGVSAATAGGLLAGMVLAGTIACAVIPRAVARRHAERKFMFAVVISAALGCVVLASAPGLVVTALVLVLMGATLLPALPIVLTAIERLAGAAAGTAGAIIWLAGNLGGIVVALLVQALVHDPSAAFLALAAVALLGVPIVMATPPDGDVR